MEKNKCFSGSIVFMLDLDGTISDINNETAKIFMKQVDILRNKFQAERAIIYISSQTLIVEELYKPIEILKQNLLPNQMVGECYHYNGIYNADKNEHYEWKGINTDKIKTFENRYLIESADTKFFAIIDDDINSMAGIKFQNDRPFAIVRPSQHFEEYLDDDNLMIYSTLTQGIDGVLEGLGRYIKNIENLSPEEIFETQKKELFSISGTFATWLLQTGQYQLLLQYIVANKVWNENYVMIADGIIREFERLDSDEVQKELLKQIAKSVMLHLNVSERYILERCL